MVAKPIKSLDELIGAEINYSQIQITGTDSFDLDDNYEKAAYFSETGKLPSTAHFTVVPIKSLFNFLLKNKRYNYSVLLLNYRTKKTYPSLIFIRISSPRSNEIAYLCVRNIAPVSGNIPDKYKDAVSDDGKLYIAGWSTLYFNAGYVKHEDSLVRKMQELVVPNGRAEFSKPMVEFVTINHAGLDTREVEIESVNLSDENLFLNYGLGFPAFNEKLINRMTSTKKGVVLFHGEPGTGKTYYIRHLVASLKKAGKRVLIIPKHVLSQMESPEFNDFMIDEFSGDEDEAVFIIEDAESVLRARDQDSDGRAVVSTLLNLSDGILNDIFRVQLICTFNTGLENIDPALLRKGRLLAKKEFGSLNKEAAQQLIDSLGIDSKAERMMNLSQIYSLGKEEDDILIKDNSVISNKVAGFRL